MLERIRYEEFRSECARAILGLIENSDENIYIHDLRGNSTLFSKAFAQLTGYTQEEIDNANFFKLFSPEFVDLVWRNILRMLADRQPSGYEAIMVIKSRYFGQCHHAFGLQERKTNRSAGRRSQPEPKNSRGDGANVERSFFERYSRAMKNDFVTAYYSV